jgi:hypothetical protein
MKKYISVFALAITFLLPSLAFAQSSPVRCSPGASQCPVLLQTYSGLEGNQTYNGARGPSEFQMGDGWTGSTTAAYISDYSQDVSSGGSGPILLDFYFEAYSGSDYLTDEENNCQFEGSMPTHSISTSTVEMDYLTGDCNFNPAYYYLATFRISSSQYGNGGFYTAADASTATPANVNSDGTPRWYNFYSAPLIPQFIVEGVGGSILPGNLPGSTLSGLSTSSVTSLCGSTFSTSTSILGDLGSGLAWGTCSAFAFLFVPDASAINNFSNITPALEATFPISWIVDIRGILQGASATSTNSYINLSLDFGTSTSALGVTDLTVISTSTLSQYLPDSVRNSALVLEGAVFWLAAASYIYRDLQRIWNKPIS